MANQTPGHPCLVGDLPGVTHARQNDLQLYDVHLARESVLNATVYFMASALPVAFWQASIRILCDVHARDSKVAMQKANIVAYIDGIQWEEYSVLCRETCRARGPCATSASGTPYAPSYYRNGVRTNSTEYYKQSRRSSDGRSRTTPECAILTQSALSSSQLAWLLTLKLDWSRLTRVVAAGPAFAVRKSNWDKLARPIAGGCWEQRVGKSCQIVTMYFVTEGRKRAGADCGIGRLLPTDSEKRSRSCPVTVKW